METDLRRDVALALALRKIFAAFLARLCGCKVERRRVTKQDKTRGFRRRRRHRRVPNLGANINFLIGGGGEEAAI